MEPSQDMLSSQGTSLKEKKPKKSMKRFWPLLLCLIPIAIVVMLVVGLFALVIIAAIVAPDQKNGLDDDDDDLSPEGDTLFDDPHYIEVSEKKDQRHEEMPNLDNDYGRAPTNWGFGDHGIIGFFIGIGRTFGGRK